MPTSQPIHRDLTHQTLGGLVWIGGGKVVYAGLRLLVLAIMARLLSPADFGIVGAALVVVGFSAIFSQLSLAPAIVQRPVLERRHLEAACSSGCRLRSRRGSSTSRAWSRCCGCSRGSSPSTASRPSPSRRCNASCG